jgi:N-methylhydantoinase A
MFVGGAVQPDRDGLHAAMQKIADRLSVSSRDVARGIIRIANGNMINALKLVSLNRGHDPRDFTLMAFGGGGGLHASALARELSIPKVIVPPNAGVFSAWGMLMIDLRRDLVETNIVEAVEENWPNVLAGFEEMQSANTELFAADGVESAQIVHQRFLDMRYVGQEHTVKVAFEASSAGALVQRFHESHEREFTFRLQQAVEIVNFHLVSLVPVEKPDLHKISTAGSRHASTAHKYSREVDLDEYGAHETAIYDRARLSSDDTVLGPAIFEEPSTTILALPGDRVTVDCYGGLHIEVAAGE